MIFRIDVSDPLTREQWGIDVEIDPKTDVTSEDFAHRFLKPALSKLQHEIRKPALVAK